MSIGNKITRLFWSPTEDGGPHRAGTAASSDDVSDAELAELAASASTRPSAPPTSRPNNSSPSPSASPGGITRPVTRPTAGATPPPPAAPAPGPPARIPATPESPEELSTPTDFTAIYTRSDTLGDPKVDQVLTAFEGMKAAMPAAQLAIAIGVTTKAIGADHTSIVDTLGKRLKVIDEARAEEQRTVTARELARTAELDNVSKQVHAEITTMEQKIATLTRQLAGATDGIQKKTTQERARLAAFDQQAQLEASRLTALRDFLATTPPTS